VKPSDSSSPPVADDSPSTAAPILIRGVGIEIPPTLHSAAVSKVAKLLRHHRRIIRVRIDFEQANAGRLPRPAIASGRLELSGPDLVARVTDTTLSSSLDLLIEKLDRMLRERTKLRVNRRNDRPPNTEFRDRTAPPEVHERSPDENSSRVGKR
jgi:putative sigma-54 modulation protein